VSEWITTVRHGIDRAARVAFAITVMNFSAVVALGALVARKSVWR
jgi:hypothetical protein